ncbi:hypothetical protein AGMMS49543_15670 [Betaproteobacteria bacterium]|nr:hypothetical protein AGMMS49543_15670 [Betaproteobacteria bacterium]GHU20628.1 hypothetical protein AGMMS50243_15900 [Betaproteobacteria bacterium]GHU32626.1 hypothetical protein FACS189497_14280 [Betaproteobacteria bacterium]
MNWELLPRRGIRIGETEIVVGAPRAEVRQAMAQHFPPPDNGRGASEDQYDHDDRMVFLRYDDADTLEQIMCINGSVHLDGLELHDTTWSELAPLLEARGYTFTEPEHYVDGQECPELGINIATHEDVGGDEDDDGIEWVAVWRPDPQP